MGNRSKQGARNRQSAAAKKDRAPATAERAPQPDDGHVLAEGAGQEASTTTEIMLQQRSGPLPDPQTLAEYDEVVPGAAERIIAQFEAQAKHRQSMETTIVHAQIADEKSDRTERRIGQFCALGVALALLATAGYCASVGQAWPASVLGGGTLVTLVAVFITGRWHAASAPAQDSKDK